MASGSIAAQPTLVDVYARYFIEDFTRSVMQQLQGSYPVPQSVLDGFITQALDDGEKQVITTTTAPNPVSRFVQECADYVATESLDYAESRDTWDQVRALPSLYHDDIQAMIYQSADLYRKTVQGTLTGVIAKDAAITAQSITQTVETQIGTLESGGVLHRFNWGLLDDGLWLNQAMLKAHNLAHIFRPNEPIKGYMVQQAFDKAHALISVPFVDDIVQAQLDLLIAQVDPHSTLEPLLAQVSQEALTKMVFKTGALREHLDGWELGVKNPSMMVGQISDMSALVRLTQVLRATAERMGDSNLIETSILTSLAMVEDVTTMALMGYQVVRETTFNNALILAVTSTEDSPIVQVYLNNDLTNRFHAAGGDDADLVQFGLYLDPKQGMPASMQGWDMDYVFNRRDAVVSEMLAHHAERQDALRIYEARLVKETIASKLQQVVSSYLQTIQIDVIPDPVQDQIRQISKDAVEVSQTGLPLDAKVFQLLLTSLNDPFLTATGQRLIDHSTHADPQIHQHAPSLTVATTALADAWDCFR